MSKISSLPNVFSSFGHVSFPIGYLFLVSVFVLHNYRVESSALAGVSGDPHFTGWDGVHFDFTGEPDTIYCMLSDTNFHINMQLQGWKTKNDTKTWIKSLGFLYGNHRVIFSAASGDQISDMRSIIREIEADGENIELALGKAYKSADNRVVISYDERQRDAIIPHDTYTLKLHEAATIVIKGSPENPDLRKKGNALFHLSLEFVDAKLSSSVHGILGQTFLNSQGRIHGGNYKTAWSDLLLVQQVQGLNADGYLDGRLDDYVSSGILYSDCSFSRYDPNFESGSSQFAEVLSGYSRKVFPGSSFGFSF